MSTRASAGKLHKPWTFKTVIQSIVNEPELLRVQTYRRPFATRPDCHNYVAWRTQELHDVTLRQLQMSLCDFVWFPSGKSTMRTVHEIYQKILQDAKKRIATETRIKHASYILPDSAQLLYYEQYLENGRYSGTSSHPVYELKARPPRQKFLANVVNLMYPNPFMAYTN